MENNQELNKKLNEFVKKVNESKVDKLDLSVDEDPLEHPSPGC